MLKVSSIDFYSKTSLDGVHTQTYLASEYHGCLAYYGLCYFEDNTIFGKSAWSADNIRYTLIDTTTNKSKKCRFEDLVNLNKNTPIAGVVTDTAGEVINIISMHKSKFRKYDFELLDYKDGVYIVKSNVQVYFDKLPEFKPIYINGIYYVNAFDFCILGELLGADEYNFGYDSNYDVNYNSYLSRNASYFITRRTTLKELVKYTAKFLGVHYVKNDEPIRQESLTLKDTDLVLNEEYIENKFGDYFNSDGSLKFKPELGLIFYNRDNLKAKFIDLSASGGQCAIRFEDGVEKRSLATSKLGSLSHPVNFDMTIDNNRVYNGFQYRCVCKNCGYAKVMSKPAAQRHYFDCTRSNKNNETIKPNSIARKIDASIEKVLSYSLVTDVPEISLCSKPNIDMASVLQSYRDIVKKNNKHTLDEEKDMNDELEVRRRQKECERKAIIESAIGDINKTKKLSSQNPQDVAAMFRALYNNKY